MTIEHQQPTPSRGVRTRMLEAAGDPRAGVAATVIGTTLAVSSMAPFEDEIGLLNEGLVLLLLTLAVSATWGWRVGVFSAVVANISLNFFFVPPLHTFTVQDPQNVFALLVFLLVSVVGGSLLSRAREAAELARRSQTETEIILQLSRDLIGRTDPTDALTALCENVVRAMGAPGAAVLSRASEGWAVLASTGHQDSARNVDPGERVIAERAFESGRVTSRGHTGMGSARARRIVMPTGHVSDMTAGTSFAPLTVGERNLGVLRLDGPISNPVFREHPEDLLEAFAREAALGVQRVELASAAAHAEALREADQMKTALMTSISHDLKTPLAGIKTSVSSLLDGSVPWSDDDRQAFLETIDSQADRLNRVISDILDLNRIEAGVIAPAFSAVHVGTLFDEVRENTTIATRPRAVTAEAEPDCYVRVDASLLRQALTNLVENAAKYSTPGTPIHLRATPARDGTVDLTVADEGPGIARQDLPHVFERFYRAEEQSRRVKGSGLGLAIVKGFVDLCGGTVHVESSPAGTHFIITLAAGEPARATA